MRKITEKLWKKKIRFKWENPLGLTFTWNDRQIIIIKTEEQMDAFLRENENDGLNT